MTWVRWPDIDLCIVINYWPMSNRLLRPLQMTAISRGGVSLENVCALRRLLLEMQKMRVFLQAKSRKTHCREGVNCTQSADCRKRLHIRTSLLNR